MLCPERNARGNSTTVLAGSEGVLLRPARRRARPSAAERRQTLGAASGLRTCSSCGRNVNSSGDASTNARERVARKTFGDQLRENAALELVLQGGLSLEPAVERRDRQRHPRRPGILPRRRNGTCGPRMVSWRRQRVDLVDSRVFEMVRLNVDATGLPGETGVARQVAFHSLVAEHVQPDGARTPCRRMPSSITCTRRRAWSPGQHRGTCSALSRTAPARCSVCSGTMPSSSSIVQVLQHPRCAPARRSGPPGVAHRGINLIWGYSKADRLECHDDADYHPEEPDSHLALLALCATVPPLGLFHTLALGLVWIAPHADGARRIAGLDRTDASRRPRTRFSLPSAR